MPANREPDEQRVLRFGPFTLDLHRSRLLRGADDLPLRAKTWAVLCYLAGRRGCVVSKDELLRAVWPDVVVTEETLTKSITEIRRVLDDNPRVPRFLRTVHGRGFCFLDSEETPVGGRRGLEAEIPPAAALGPMRDRMVGRGDEMAVLSRCWTEARGGQRRLVFVTGEPGIGKTMLVDTFLEAALDQRRGAPVWVARGCCVQQHGAGEAYLPVLDALDQLVRQPAAANLPEILHRNAPTWMANLPWLRAGQPAAPAPAAEDVRPQRMLREFAAFVEAATAVQPLLLALEDLHWSDPSTVDLLFMLAQRRESARLLIIGMYRNAELAATDHPLAAVRQTLRARRQSREIALEGLDAAGVQDYLRQRCPGADSTELAAIVHAHSDGTPLFVVAMVDHLIRRGWLIETDPGWALSVSLSQVDPGVPDDVREIIRAELRSLRPREQSLLETASVAGVEFDAQAVAAAMRTPTDAAEALCERLARAGRFLRVAGRAAWPDGSVARRYAFRHALHRQVVYDDVPDARRCRCHLRVGEALEHAHADRPESIAGVLAHHFQRGGDPSRAIRYLAAAAAAAHGRCAPREAIAHLESALCLVGDLPDHGERGRQGLALRLQIGPSLNAVHGYASQVVRDNYQAALALCDADTPGERRYAVLHALWYSHAMRAERDETWRSARELVAQAAQLGPAERWLAQSLLGRTATYDGEFAEARARLEPLRAAWPQGSESDAPLFGPAPMVASDGHLAHTLWFLGFPDQARSLAHDALARAERGDSPFTLAAALFHFAYLAYLRGEPEQTERFAERLGAVAGEQGFPYWEGLAYALSGWPRLRTGDPAGAVSRIESSLSIMRVNSARLFSAQILGFLAEALGQLGRLDGALAAADEGLALTATTLDRFVEPELWRLRGEVLAQRARPRRRSPAGGGGDAEAAEWSMRRSLDLARSLGSRSLELRAALSLAELLTARGARAEARSIVGPVYDWFTEGHETADLRRAAAFMARA